MGFPLCPLSQYWRHTLLCLDFDMGTGYPNSGSRAYMLTESALQALDYVSYASILFPTLLEAGVRSGAPAQLGLVKVSSWPIYQHVVPRLLKFSGPAFGGPEDIVSALVS